MPAEQQARDSTSRPAVGFSQRQMFQLWLGLAVTFATLPFDWLIVMGGATICTFAFSAIVKWQGQNCRHRHES